MDPFCVNRHPARAAHPRLNGVLPSSDDIVEIPRALFDRLTDTLAFAAELPLIWTKPSLVLSPAR